MCVVCGSLKQLRVKQAIRTEEKGKESMKGTTKITIYPSTIRNTNIHTHMQAHTHSAYFELLHRLSASRREWRRPPSEPVL